jgi:hypothetical protein
MDVDRIHWSHRRFNNRSIFFRRQKLWKLLLHVYNSRNLSLSLFDSQLHARDDQSGCCRSNSSADIWPHHKSDNRPTDSSFYCAERSCLSVSPSDECTKHVTVHNFHVHSIQHSYSATIAFSPEQ